MTKKILLFAIILITSFNIYAQSSVTISGQIIDKETKEGGLLFEKAMSTARHWHNVLDGIILQADQISRLQVEGTQEKEMAEATP